MFARCALGGAFTCALVPIRLGKEAERNQCEAGDSATNRWRSCDAVASVGEPSKRGGDDCVLLALLLGLLPDSALHIGA